ncbi:hypothetical protein AVDCRST_MAG81-3020 [uncultured Synechococcales cyanobacterium]|uniref:Uncharacterized protein n=1 Tax=uncultured Synechococcales cyanobacterium TaxID=1936017 RepID=A0A6J4V9F2_9CYAN|nr:hypothetical protein AVDCRST_MAG81-3020 [uncultured Synechococcales cyanobacterium]
MTFTLVSRLSWSMNQRDKPLHRTSTNQNKSLNQPFSVLAYYAASSVPPITE